MATLLPLPDDPRFALLVREWQVLADSPLPYPRSVWLRQYENLLRAFYPQASSRDLSLTARHAAPFYLAQGPNVP